MQGRFWRCATADRAGTQRTPRRAATDGYDQGLVDLVRGAQIAFGIALPGGGTQCEFGLPLCQRTRRGEKLGQREPASEAGSRV
jgi:hypothetical protein